MNKLRGGINCSANCRQIINSPSAASSVQPQRCHRDIIIFYHGTWALLLDVQVRDYCSTNGHRMRSHPEGQHHLMAAPGKSGSKTIYAGGEAGGADGGLQVVL